MLLFIIKTVQKQFLKGLSESYFAFSETQSLRHNELNQSSQIPITGLALQPLRMIFIYELHWVEAMQIAGKTN